MTEQEAFDTVVRHLFAQGRQSASGAPPNENKCLYRGPGGAKCAVGCLIPDRLYDPAMEDKNSEELVHGAFPSLGFLAPLSGILYDLQWVHDSDENWKDAARMKRALRRVAVRRGLSAAALDGLRMHTAVRDRLPGGA